MEWKLWSANGQLDVWLSPDQPGAGGITTHQGGWAVYYRGDAPVELTADNWQDYFELRVVCYLQPESSGELKFMTSCVMAPREGCPVLGVRNGSVVCALSGKSNAKAHFSPESGAWTPEEMTSKEQRIFLRNFFFLKKVSVDVPFQNTTLGDSISLRGAVLCSVAYSVPPLDGSKGFGPTKEGVVIDSGTIIVPIVTEFSINIKEISGQLFL